MTTILLTSIILILLGALDDAVELGVIFRLIAQLACSLIVIGSGLIINNIGDYMFTPQIQIGYLSILFTVFCWLSCRIFRGSWWASFYRY